MAKKSKFVKDFLIKKSLGDFKEDFNKGEKVLMFKNVYKVMSDAGSSQVLLQDLKGMNIALPADRLRLLLKNRTISKLTKSNGGKNLLTPQGFIVERKKPTARMAGRVEAATGVQGEGSRGGKIVGHTKSGKPIYESQQGNRGRYFVQRDGHEHGHWVDMQSGHGYDENDSADEHHHLNDPRHLDEAHKIHRTIYSRTHPGDHDNLKGLLHDYYGAENRYRNMRAAMSHAHKQGGNIPSADHEKLDRMNREVADKKEKFKQAMLRSHKKRLGEK